MFPRTGAILVAYLAGGAATGDWRSHFNSSDADSSLQEWYISGNDKVDKAAARIHLVRSDSFLHVARGLKSHFSGSRNLVDTQLAFCLDISRFDLSILSKGHAGFDPEDVKLSSLVDMAYECWPPDVTI